MGTKDGLMITGGNNKNKSSHVLLSGLSLQSVPGKACVFCLRRAASMWQTGGQTTGKLYVCASVMQQILKDVEDAVHGFQFLLVYQTGVLLSLSLSLASLDLWAERKGDTIWKTNL